MANETKKWAMPQWMQPYAGMLEPGRSIEEIEELATGSTNIEVNAVLALLEMGTNAKVGLLTQLKQAGLLLPPSTREQGVPVIVVVEPQLKSTPNRMCEWLLQAVYDRMQQRVFSDTTAVLRFAEALANEASAKYPDCVPASYHVPYGYEPGSGQMPLQIGPKHWCVRMRMYEIRTNQTDAAS